MESIAGTSQAQPRQSCGVVLIDDEGAPGLFQVAEQPKFSVESTRLTRRAAAANPTMPETTQLSVMQNKRGFTGYLSGLRTGTIGKSNTSMHARQMRDDGHASPLQGKEQDHIGQLQLEREGASDEPKEKHNRLPNVDTSQCCSKDAGGDANTCDGNVHGGGGTLDGQAANHIGSAPHVGAGNQLQPEGTAGHSHVDAEMLQQHLSTLLELTQQKVNSSINERAAVCSGRSSKLMKRHAFGPGPSPRKSMCQARGTPRTSPCRLQAFPGSQGTNGFTEIGVNQPIAPGQSPNLETSCELDARQNSPNSKRQELLSTTDRVTDRPHGSHTSHGGTAKAAAVMMVRDLCFACAACHADLDSVVTHSVISVD
jgi:hypothetical protein